MITSIQIIKEVIEKVENISAIRFISFDGYELFNDSVKDDNQVQVAVDVALKIREEHSLPFWDCFNLSLFDRDFTSFDFLKRIKFHNKINNVYTVKINDLTDFIDNLEMKNYLTLNSEFILADGSPAHIPMLDFHIPVSQKNTRLCRAILKELGLNGYLLDSGKSYHFIGNSLMCKEKLSELLHFALLFSPIIDKSWLAHQLIQGSCCLRISNKYERQPFLIEQI